MTGLVNLPENTYKATVVRLPAPEPHNNADSLAIYRIKGVQVILSNQYKGGELGIFLPEDGQVSVEFAEYNNLIGYVDEKGNRKGGMMDHKRRVRAINLRGEKSYGLWLPIESLAFLGDYEFVEGQELKEVGDHVFCNKYYTDKTLDAIANSQRHGKKGERKKSLMFPEHIDTKKYANEIDRVLSTGYSLFDAIITEKVHGTSGRFGYVKRERPYPWYHPARWFGLTRPEWVHLIGSRRVVLGEDREYKPFYGTEQFRHESVKDLYGRLHKGEVIYFELVGWVNDQSPIMPAVNTEVLKDKTFVKQYGKEMAYTYGTTRGQVRLIVYRIAMVNEDGVSVDLTWPQVKERCNQLGLEYVKEVAPFYYSWEEEHDRRRIIEELADGPSFYDPRHIREGIVLRFESKELTPIILKLKSHVFLVLEGHTKDREDYLDMEESS